MEIRNEKANVKTLHNLRPEDDNPEVFIPIGPIKQVANQRFDPLYPWTSDTVIANGSDGLYSVDIPSGEARRFGHTEGMCATRTDADRLVVMTSDGPKVYESTENGFAGDDETPWAEHDENVTLFPPISITAEPMAALTMDIDGIQLSRNYLPGDIVSGTDRLTVRRELADAYRRLTARAGAQGVFFQPFMVRAVAKDKYGAVLHRSPIILIMPPEGLPLDKQVRLDMISDNETQGLSLEIPTFRLRVKCVGMPERLRRPVAEIIIEASPEFHPWQPDVADGSGAVTVIRQNASAPALSVELPGESRSLSAGNRERNRTLLLAVTGSFDTIRYRLATFAGIREGGMDAQVNSHAMPVLPLMTKDVDRALAESRDGAEVDSLFRLKTPHTFTALHVASTPSAVLYGNIKALPYEGYSPADYASAFESIDGKWYARSVVRFRNGDTAVRYSEGSGTKPVELGPWISYPDPEATCMDIVVEDDTEGSVPRVWHIELTPDCPSGCAYALTDSLSHRIPDTDTTAWITDRISSRPKPVDLPGEVCVASSRCPLNPTATVNAGSEVRGILASANSTGAWDYGRTRFTVFTAETVSTVNASSDLQKLATGIIAKTGIADREAVTMTDTAEIFFVGDTGTIFRLTGTKAKILVGTEESVDRICYDATDRRLIITHSSGKIPLYHLDTTTGKAVMTTDSPGPTGRWLKAGPHSLCATEKGLADLSIGQRSTNYETTMVRLTATAQSGSMKRPIRSVVWYCYASRFEGSLRICRHYLAPDNPVVTSLRINGSLRAPLPVRMMGRPIHHSLLVLEAKVSPSSFFTSPHFTF